MDLNQGFYEIKRSKWIKSLYFRNAEIEKIKKRTFQVTKQVKNNLHFLYSVDLGRLLTTLPGTTPNNDKCYFLYCESKL